MHESAVTCKQTAAAYKSFCLHTPVVICKCMLCQRKYACATSAPLVGKTHKTLTGICIMIQHITTHQRALACNMLQQMLPDEYNFCMGSATLCLPFNLHFIQPSLLTVDMTWLQRSVNVLV